MGPYHRCRGLWAVWNDPDTKNDQVPNSRFFSNHLAIFCGTGTLAVSCTAGSAFTSTGFLAAAAARAACFRRASRFIAIRLKTTPPLTAAAPAPNERFSVTSSR